MVIACNQDCIAPGYSPMGLQPWYWLPLSNCPKSTAATVGMLARLLFLHNNSAGDNYSRVSRWQSLVVKLVSLIRQCSVFFAIRLSADSVVTLYGLLAHTKLLHNVQWEPSPGSSPTCDYAISIEIVTRWLVTPIINNNNNIIIVIARCSGSVFPCS